MVPQNKYYLIFWKWLVNSFKRLLIKACYKCPFKKTAFKPTGSGIPVFQQVRVLFHLTVSFIYFEIHLTILRSYSIHHNNSTIVKKYNKLFIYFFFYMNHLKTRVLPLNPDFRLSFGFLSFGNNDFTANKSNSYSTAE